MDKDFWLDRWKLGQIGFHQKEINSHLQEFWPHLGAQAGQRVFVPLCGKSLDMDWLLAQGHPVVGVELAESAIQEFFAGNQLQPVFSESHTHKSYQASDCQIWCGDYFQLLPSQLLGANFVFDRASMIALPPAMRVNYVHKMAELVPKGAQSLLITIEYDSSKMQGPPFSVSEEEVKNLYAPHAQLNLLFEKDVLRENIPFQGKLDWLMERVHLLRW
jgi:thiopurine S-methyltransferase